MMRALYSSVAGLRIHQTKTDVIGNNISNVNTVGFKASSVTFTDVLYQTTQSASGPNAELGTVGSNAMQIGLGAAVGAITTNMNTGSAQNTGRALDVMINGDAFFVVQDNGSRYFTKAGSFTVDANGTLCTTTGKAVMGWRPDASGEKINVDKVQTLDVMSAENLITPPIATTKAHFTGNIDREDKQFKDGKVISVPIYDNLGNKYTANFKFKNTTEAANGSLNKYEVSLVDVRDAQGVDITTRNFQTEFATTTIQFNGSTGKIEPVNTGGTTDEAKNSLVLKLSGNPNPFGRVNETGNDTTTGVSIDFGQLTCFATTGTSTIELQAGDRMGNKAGKAVGNMKGLSIDQEGKIFGTYDTGDKKLLGQIAVASFANPSGLEAVGESMFKETMNSGEFNGVGKNIASIGGSMTSGVLEMSNVDLANEFTELIVAQRGYQANSRIISTADSLLEELINLKR